MARALIATVARTPNACTVRAGQDQVVFQADDGVLSGAERADAVAWLMLPVAMRLGTDLVIEGVGSSQTERQAMRLAATWSRWVPGHFRPVRVRFAQSVDGAAQGVAEAPAGGDLCFYSGGVDSTYMLLRRRARGDRQTLLTLHGMDYRWEDDRRFKDFVDKTTPFAQLVADRRILLQTNAYDVYKKHKVNPPGSDVGHGFVLAAGAFLFAAQHAKAVLAADYRLDQQFDVHPWGTNTATNRCFDDGRFRIATECEDVGRTDKMPLVASCAEALASLTFCVDYKSRPHNCGRCQKCVRTKAMFMVACGQVPDIFLYRPLDAGCLEAFDLSKPHQRVFMSDLHEAATLADTLSRIPGLDRFTPSFLARQATGSRRRWLPWRA